MAHRSPRKGAFQILLPAISEPASLSVYQNTCTVLVTMIIVATLAVEHPQEDKKGAP